MQTKLKGTRSFLLSFPLLQIQMPVVSSLNKFYNREKEGNKIKISGGTEESLEKKVTNYN